MKNAKFILFVSLVSGLLPAVILFATGETAGALFALGITAAVFALIWFVFLRNMVRQARVLKTGEPGMARILNVSDTGMTINDNPVVKLDVEVTPRRGPKYNTTTRVLVSRINPGAFSPGMEVPVKIDPNDVSYIAVDIAAINAGAVGGSPTQVFSDTENEKRAAMEALLRENDTMQKEVLATGSDAEGVILNSWNLGVNVNDMAVAMEFLVEVKIPGRSPFKTEVKGVVALQSIPKYRNGARVKIKYDPSDPEKRLTFNGVV